jgi:hypothetical protein
LMFFFNFNNFSISSISILFNLIFISNVILIFYCYLFLFFCHFLDFFSISSLIILFHLIFIFNFGPYFFLLFFLYPKTS